MSSTLLLDYALDMVKKRQPITVYTSRLSIQKCNRSVLQKLNFRTGAFFSEWVNTFSELNFPSIH